MKVARPLGLINSSGGPAGPVGSHATLGVYSYSCPRTGLNVPTPSTRTTTTCSTQAPQRCALANAA